jgi:hypothetical protein
MRKKLHLRNSKRLQREKYAKQGEKLKLKYCPKIK